MERITSDPEIIHHSTGLLVNLKRGRVHPLTLLVRVFWHVLALFAFWQLFALERNDLIEKIV
jgi:hypothetical protein